MNAISLWQPWASLIADERKRIETRHWAPPARLVGKRIAIHAAKKLDKEAAKEFGYGPADIPRGAIVAVVTLESFFQFTEWNTRGLPNEEKKAGDFYPGRYGWRLSEINKLLVPVPLLGHQGFFWWDEMAEAR